MPPQSIQHYLKQILTGIVHTTISSLQFSSVGGGSINETYKVKTNGNDTFFLKLNSVPAFPSLFEKEKNGLAFLAQQKLIRTPGIVTWPTTRRLTGHRSR